MQDTGALIEHGQFRAVQVAPILVAGVGERCLEVPKLEGCLQEREGKECAPSQGVALRKAPQHEMQGVCHGNTWMHVVSFKVTLATQAMEKTKVADLQGRAILMLFPCCSRFRLIKAIRFHLGVLHRKVTRSYLHFRKFNLAKENWVDLRACSRGNTERSSKVNSYIRTHKRKLPHWASPRHESRFGQLTLAGNASVKGTKQTPFAILQLSFS